MADQVRVKIGGTLLEKVISVETGIDVASGFDGHPQDARPRLVGIRITRASDKKLDLWDWSTKPWAESYRKGTIEFLDPEKKNKVIKTISWEDGFVTSYTESVPHVQFQREAAMTETIVISPRVLDLDGPKIVAYKK